MSDPSAAVGFARTAPGGSLTPRCYRGWELVSESAHARRSPVAGAFRDDIPTDDFRMLNRRLDDAIAGAGTTYGEARDRSIDGEAAAESDRAAALASDLRRLIRTSRAALDVIASGSVRSLREYRRGSATKLDVGRGCYVALARRNQRPSSLSSSSVALGGPSASLLLTGGLLVRIQPEEPIKSTT